MDTRVELELIRKHYREYSRVAGEHVVWYEFLPFGAAASASGSFYDPVYDEGISGAGGRKYKNGVAVPVLMITETEDQKRSIPEGRQPVEVVNFVASIDEFRKVGVTNPFEYRQHLNDLFTYDGRYFTVTSYKVRGRARDDIIVVVEGLEVYINQEHSFDPTNTFNSISSLPWPSSLPTI
jgi:hypothetical protein